MDQLINVGRCKSPVLFGYISINLMGRVGVDDEENEGREGHEVMDQELVALDEELELKLSSTTLPRMQLQSYTSIRRNNNNTRQAAYIIELEAYIPRHLCKTAKFRSPHLP